MSVNENTVGLPLFYMYVTIFYLVVTSGVPVRGGDKNGLPPGLPRLYMGNGRCRPGRGHYPATEDA